MNESWLSRFFRRWGVLPVLVVICAALSIATISVQSPSGSNGGEALAHTLLQETKTDARVLLVAGDGVEDAAFSRALQANLEHSGRTIAAEARGEPWKVRETLARLQTAGVGFDAVAATEQAALWPALLKALERNPAWADIPVFTPSPRRVSIFLTQSNLLNILQQISVIAILAIGMTMVIVAGGIDLSVGSLMALSAIISSLLLRDWFGGVEASIGATLLCGFAALAACVMAGLVNGLLITQFQLPAFIVTLGMLLLARGGARLLSEEQSISQIPAHFSWLGSGAELAGIPNAVVLMAVLYLLAHLIMTRTTLGRSIYAVGGNAEAARLSGVPVARVITLTYVVSGFLAGLGGLILASRLRSGDPKFGDQYELDVIAAVVVGGASLRGGEGRIVGTLFGALLIAVIRNGMNLLGVRSSLQMIMLGVVILFAVLTDRSKAINR